MRQAGVWREAGREVPIGEGSSGVQMLEGYTVLFFVELSGGEAKSWLVGSGYECVRCGTGVSKAVVSEDGRSLMYLYNIL